MTTYPHLGFDPVASDEAVGSQIADELRHAVGRLQEVDAVLSGSGEQNWQGRTAEAFRGEVDDELRPRVAEALSSFSTASRSFDGWVAALPGYRRRADALEAEAEEAAARVSAAANRLTSLEAPGAGADQAARDRFQDQQGAARSSLTRMEGDLAAIQSRARSLKSEIEGHASEVASAFDTAMRAAPDEPGLFGRIGEFMEKVGEVLAEAFDWFMENLAPLIQKLARVIGAIATILSIVAFVVGFVFPPAFALAGTLGTIAKVAAFVDLGIQGLRVLHGEEGAMQGFALQAGGMLLGIGAARAIGPIAMNAQSNIRNGLFVPQLAMVSVGTNGGAAVAAQAIKINPDFTHSLLYWGVTSYQSLRDSAQTIDQETR